jgi:hypothetical protein
MLTPKNALQVQIPIAIINKRCRDDSDEPLPWTEPLPAGPAPGSLRIWTLTNRSAPHEVAKSV